MKPNIDEALFDVRAIPCRIKHGQIFQRWLELPVGSHFVLINDHDPIPLRYQFEAEFAGAFSWDYLQRGPEEFHVKITKVAPVRGMLAVDARGLEPPEPLVRILDALASLPAGVALRAQTDREPCHLFGAARQLGFEYECKQQPDGSWTTVLTLAEV